MDLGKESYRVFTNNCADMIETIFETGTKINLPTGLSPKPNSNFDKIKKNQAQIQKMSNKNGPRLILRINKDAKLSEPLKNLVLISNYIR